MNHTECRHFPGQRGVFFFSFKLDWKTICDLNNQGDFEIYNATDTEYLLVN